MPPIQQAAAPLTTGADQASEIARLKRELARVQMEQDILKKDGHLLGSTEMRFQIIADCCDEYPVRVLCDAIGVSPSGYYAWRMRPESPRKAANRQLLDDIRCLHDAYRQRYGVPRIHAALRANGHTASRGRVERLMRRHGLRAQRAKAYRVCTTDSRHGLPVAPNRLDRDFAPATPN